MTHFAWTYALGRRENGLWRSRKAATAVEYAMVAFLAVTAWSAVESPRSLTASRADQSTCAAPARGHAPRWDRSAIERSSRTCKARLVSKA